MDDVRERRVRIVFSHDAMLRLYDRAHRWGIDQGGRFEPLGGGIVLWSAPPARDPEGAEPTCAFSVVWGQEAAIWKLAWIAEAGGSEEEVRRAVAFLADPDDYREEDDGGFTAGAPSPRKPPPEAQSREETV